MFIDQIEEPKDKKDFSMRKNKTIKVGDLVQVASILYLKTVMTYLFIGI